MIRYRHGQITRADDSTADDAPLRIILANEGLQADGLDLRMSGVDLARFLSNPVLGYGHNYTGRDSLPIGRVEDVDVDGAQLLGTAVFDRDDEFAVTVERKIRQRFLNAFSIGFDFDPDSYDRKTGEVRAWELYELSTVPIPMDAGALVAAGRSAAILFGGAVDLTPPVRDDTGRSVDAADGGADGDDENPALPHELRARHRALQLSGVIP